MNVRARNGGQNGALGGRERVEESMQCFAESLNLCPENAWAYYNRALVLQKTGDVQGAIDELRRSLQLDQPSLPERLRAEAEVSLKSLT